MPVSRFSGDATASVDILVSRIRASEAQAAFDGNHWAWLKMRLAVTPAIDLAGVAAKLRLVHHGIQIDADPLDSDILESAISDLRRVTKTTGQP